MYKAARDLHQEVLATVEKTGATVDPRFKNWVRTISGIDYGVTSEIFTVLGRRIRPGIGEFLITPRLFLACTFRGTGKYQHATYTVVEMDAQGALHYTGIQMNEEGGVAASNLLREAVERRLKELAEGKVTKPRYFAQRAPHTGWLVRYWGHANGVKANRILACGIETQAEAQLIADALNHWPPALQE